MNARPRARWRDVKKERLTHRVGGRRLADNPSASPPSLPRVFQVPFLSLPPYTSCIRPLQNPLLVCDVDGACIGTLESLESQLSLLLYDSATTLPFSPCAISASPHDDVVPSLVTRLYAVHIGAQFFI